MSELNPNHPVTASVHDHWHKVVALLLHKFDLGEVVITASDLDDLAREFAGGMPAVLIHDKADGMHLKIVTEAEAMALAREHGGLPQ